MTTYDHGTMVANIIATYDRASASQVEAGKRWYPTALGIVRHIADASGIDPMRIAYALAALSPRNPWRWNVFDCYSYAMARAEGRTMPTATTFSRNRLRAWKALSTTGAPWSTEAPKVHEFVSAILGAEDAVVVDQWAHRVAMNSSVKAVSNRAYRLVSRAYTEAAEIVGETPRSLQAITWLVAQTEGLATHRKGRHDLSWKEGTPESLKELLS